MIRYFKICKKYSELGVNNKRYLIPLLISSILKSTIVLLFPIFISNIVEYATIRDFDTAIYNVIYLGITYYIYNIIFHWYYVAYRDNNNYVYTKLQENVVKKVSTYDENFTKKISKSFLVNSTSGDTLDVSNFADNAICALSHLISLIISLIITITYNIYIGLIVLIFNIIYLLLLGYTQKKKDYYLGEQRKEQDNIGELFSQTLDGTKEIKSFDMIHKLNEILDKIKLNWSKQYFKKRKYWDISSVLLPMIIMVSKIVAYIYVIYFISKGYMTVGSLILIIGYIDRVQNENTEFFNRANNMCNSSVRIDRINNIINYKNKNIMTYGDNDTDDIKGEISFKDVSFTYENNLILDNVSFNIKPHSLTAIVGKSGSGKSTIFRLLLRLYKLQEGTITIDNINIYDYTQEVYVKNVSIATQKPFIFNMSIKDNLSLVDSNRENQIQACKRVGIHDFIESLPDGYNTILKEDAVDISGGQKQLISLARTLLSKSEILLLDEVTSALDPITVKQVTKVLKDLKKDHTVVMITHKPSLMKISDKLLVIDKGKLVGNGTHKELIKKNKYYKILHK